MSEGAYCHYCKRYRCVCEVRDAGWLKRGIDEVRKELKKWPKWKRTTRPVPHD